MKKVTFIIIFALILSLGASQVFAATVLNTNLLSLITDGLGSLKSYFVTLTEKKTTNIYDDYSSETEEYLNNKTSEIIGELQKHKDLEISRSENELNAYFNSLKNEIDTLTDAQVEIIKDNITQEVNKSTEKTKKQIEKEIEKYFKDIVPKD